MNVGMAVGATEPYYQKYGSVVVLDDEVLTKLRPGQRGAVFAIRSWAVAPDGSVAILGLPTGYGKSELIALTPFLFPCRRVLIIAPSVVVRSQLKERVETQEHLRRIGVVPARVPLPRVLEHSGRIESPRDWNQFADFDVVVSHTQSVSPANGPVIDPPDPGLFDLLIFDEAHHLGSPSWIGVRAAFPDAAAIGFTATPYRRDRRSLPGRTIFQYPIDKAVDERFFVPITYRLVKSAATEESRDIAVAAEAIAELGRRNDTRGRPAARLLVRADTVKRAEDLAALYHRISPEVSLEVITHETTRSQLEDSILRLRTGESSGVAFVGVLGEGFDLPSLKVAAYHNPHRSLPVTIQFAGRVARTETSDAAGPEFPEEHAILIATDEDHPKIVSELHRDGQRWDRLIPELARALGEGSSRAWAVSSADTADMAAAFTVENFRTFLLADVYLISRRPDPAALRGRLSSLHVTTPPQDADPVSRETAPPRDSVRVIKVIRKGPCYALLLTRERQLPWLYETPSGQQEYDYMVLAVTPHKDGSRMWLCVRSTLPADITARALDDVFGRTLNRPPRSDLAQYRGAQWAAAGFTGLGKRPIHPVVAGVLSYETGAGRSVDQAITLDDRALNECGHAIGIVPAWLDGDKIQIGIAMEKRRVWQTGYAPIDKYGDWAESLCREIEGNAPIKQIGGLRVADSPLDSKAQPTAAMFGPRFDANWDAQYRYQQDTEPVPFRDVNLVPQRRQQGGDIKLSLSSRGSVLGVVAYSPDGQLLQAPGKFIRSGRQEYLLHRLERDPITVFFNDGSVLRGPGGCISPLDAEQYFAISSDQRRMSRQPIALAADNRFAVLDERIILLPEKNGRSMREIFGSLGNIRRSSVPASLFQFTVKQARAEEADFIFCDDGTREVADFIIAWRVHPRTGGPHVRLVHCKAMATAERRRISDGEVGVRLGGLEQAEEVCQQVLRSVGFWLSSPDKMVDHMEMRSRLRPERSIRGTMQTFHAVASQNQLNLTAEIWAIHPGLSRMRLVEPAGKPLLSLLSAVRTRCVDARADFAVLGRA